MFKRGDVVKVWSLQSFNGGGFLDGETAIVRQDQGASARSVLLIVTRNLKTSINRDRWKHSLHYALDTSYEVYDKQIELIKKTDDANTEMVKEFLDLNQKIRTYEHTQLMKQNIHNCTPYHYAPEFYIDENNMIQLDKNLLEFPEAFI